LKGAKCTRNLQREIREIILTIHTRHMGNPGQIKSDKSVEEIVKQANKEDYVRFAEPNYKRKIQ